MSRASGFVLFGLAVETVGEPAPAEGVGLPCLEDGEPLLELDLQPRLLVVVAFDPVATGEQIEAALGGEAGVDRALVATGIDPDPVARREAIGEDVAVEAGAGEAVGRAAGLARPRAARAGQDQPVGPQAVALEAGEPSILDGGAHLQLDRSVAADLDTDVRILDAGEAFELRFDLVIPWRQT